MKGREQTSCPAALFQGSEHRARGQVIADVIALLFSNIICILDTFALYYWLIKHFIAFDRGSFTAAVACFQLSSFLFLHADLAASPTLIFVPVGCSAGGLV